MRVVMTPAPTTMRNDRVYAQINQTKRFYLFGILSLTLQFHFHQARHKCIRVQSKRNTVTIYIRYFSESKSAFN